MDDFTTDDLIELYILLDVRIRENYDLLDSGEPDPVSRNELLRMNSKYNGLKRKIAKILKSAGITGIKLSKKKI